MSDFIVIGQKYKEPGIYIRMNITSPYWPFLANNRPIFLQICNRMRSVWFIIFLTGFVISCQFTSMALVPSERARCNNGFVSINHHSVLPADFSYSDTCSGAPTFFFSIVNAPDSVTWIFGDPSSGGANFSVLANPSHVYSLPGQYTVTLTAWQSGIPETEIKIITINSTPSPYLGTDIDACAGNSVTLNPGNFPGAVIQWQDGSVSPTYTLGTNGQYTVAVTDDGCTGRDTVEAVFNNIPVVNLGADRAACQGESILLDAFNPGANYLWQNGSNSSTLAAGVTGVYSVTVSIGNCSAGDQVLLTFNPSPALNLGQDTVICKGFPLFLDATNPGATYLWQDGSIDPFIFADSAGLYSVTVTINTCSASDTIIIDEQEKPKVFLGEDSLLCLGMTYRLDAFNYGAAYEWQDGSMTAWYDARTSGKYFVTATNNCGVSADTIYLTFLNCECLVYLPDAFSPNRDNRNDLYRFTSNCNEFSGTLEIFNRSGKRLFVSQSQDSGWDGTFEDKEVPAGAYIYVMKYRGYDNGRYVDVKKRGSFLLTR